MKLPPRLLILLTLSALIGITVVVVGITGLITGPPQPDPVPAEELTPRTDASSSRRLGELPMTDDPERFARGVAEVIFDWDTTRLTSPDQLIEHVMTVADPSGYEAPGLYQDLQTYLPTLEQWRKLREYETRQQITDVLLTVPREWELVAADTENEIAEGTTAITIDATRLREGVWHGEAASSDSALTFTMFVACPPATEQCALLRLSALGSALR